MLAQILLRKAALRRAEAPQEGAPRAVAWPPEAAQVPQGARSSSVPRATLRPARYSATAAPASPTGQASRPRPSASWTASWIPALPRAFPQDRRPRAKSDDASWVLTAILRTSTATGCRPIANQVLLPRWSTGAGAAAWPLLSAATCRRATPAPSPSCASITTTRTTSSTACQFPASARATPHRHASARWCARAGTSATWQARARSSATTSDRCAPAQLDIAYCAARGNVRLSVSCISC